MAIFVEFFECAIIKDVASIPYVTTMLVRASVGDVLGPTKVLGIVFIKVLIRDVGEEVVTDPAREWADPKRMHNI